MIHRKISFLTTFLCLVIALPFSFAQTDNNTPLTDKVIYNFPPPMDDPSFPFKVVTIDATTPEWAKLLYEANPNIRTIRKLYHKWRQQNPDSRNGHTRNFRKLSGYLAYNNFVNDEGFIDIPTESELEAESDKILEDRAKDKGKGDITTSLNANNTTWQLVGPTFMKSTSGVVTDRQINIYSITQSLSNTDILYCTSEAGGTVFKTTDHGDNWFSVSDDLITNMGSRNIEVAPSNPNIVYLCTKHDIYKTTVGGNVWNSVYNANNSSNLTLIIHPTNPDIVMAGGANGILKTIDGGTTWTNPLPAKTVYDLRYKPGDTQTIYALVDNSSTKQTDFYKSTDGGDTWTVRSTGWPNEISNGNKGGQMTTSDGNPEYIYAFVGANWAASPESVNIKILKSTDYGESWTTVVDYDNSFGINDGQGYYDWDIEMSDTNPDVVYGGTQGRWVTKDGFQTTNQDIGSLGHADVQEVLFNGTDLWVVNDGGIILFADENFQSYTAKSKGINAISYWSFDQGWNKDVSSGTHYHNGTSIMHENYETNIGITLGGAEPSFSLVAHPSGEKMVSKGYGSVNGYTMPDAQDGTYNRFSYNLTPNIYSYSGNNVGVHPLATETHFLGVENALMKSIDFGVTWDTLYKFPSANDYIWDIELTRANTDAIFVSTIDNAGGSLYRSLDRGQSFTEIVLPSQFSGNPKILNVSVSNEDANTFYVMSDRYGIKIAKTTDGGVTWTDLNTATLDAYDGHKIMQVDGTNGGIYLLTTRAVFYRNNTLADWVALTTGMPANTSYNYIRPFYRDKELRIATSRGVYKAELYETPQLSNQLLQPSTKKTITDCVRDTFYFDDYSVVEHAGATWAWSFPGANYVSATNVRNPKVVYGNTGQFDVTMSITKGGQTFTKTVEKMITVGSACTEVDNFAGKALQLNRTTKDRAVTEDFNLTTNTFTFSAWIKPTESFQAFQGVFSNGVWCAHCNEQTLGLIMNYNGNRLYYRWPNSTSSWGSASNLYPKLEEWSYVAFVMSPDKVTLYLNEEKWESTISHDPATINQLYLGFGHYSKYFNGQIEEATFWKKSLTDQEIKELMHLTKAPTTDPDLLAYYQFNEDTGDILDKAGITPARLLENAERVISTAPIGGGRSQIQTESAGTVSFSTADFEANFTNQSGVEVVASKINNVPYNLNGLITGEVPLAEEYWAVHRYENGDFEANLTFKTSVDISTSDAANACQYALYQRGNRSDEDWEYFATATSVDAATDKITFTANVSEWAQYLIVKSTTPIIRGDSPVVLRNTSLNTISAESNYTIAAANLSGNLQITAPTGFEVSTTSGSGFTNSLSLSPTAGKIPNTTIYVRFTPTEQRLYSEAITHSSTGATDLLVAINGNGIALACSPGTALSLDGSSDYVNLGNPTELQITGDLTIQMWLKPSNFSARRNALGKAYGGEYTINVETDGKVNFYNGSSGGNSGGYEGTESNQSIPLDEWTYITVVRDINNKTLTWYINGVQDLQRTNATTNIVAGSNDVYIGEGYVSGFAGLIDEVRIWNTPLSEQQIQEEMHLTLKGDETGLVAYYQFNEASGNAKDYINDLDGSFVNDATRSIATEPVGCGFSNAQMSPSGATTFTNTAIEAFYSTTTDKVVATKLKVAPNTTAGIGASESAAEQQYWVLKHYGGANDKNANLTFTLEEGITGSEVASAIKLYGRNQTSDGDWILITTANSIDATNNTATFNNVMTYHQYLIIKAPFPKLLVDKNSLALGNVTVGTQSGIDSVKVSGTDLTSAINITAPSSFEISLAAATGFTNNIDLTPSGGNVTETTIYIRFAPTTNGYQSGQLTLSSTGLADKIIDVDGAGIYPEIELRQNATVLANGNTIDFGNLAVNSSKSILFTIKNIDLGTLELPNLPTITVSGTDVNDFIISESPSDTSLATNESTTFKITFTPNSSGAKSAMISIINSDPDENPYTLNLTGLGDPIPTITISSLTNFGNELVGNSSTEKTYTISGTNLVDAITLSSTTGFEISLSSGSGFSNGLRLQPTNGSIATTTIYVRFTPVSVANYTGTILHTSPTAETKVIAISGSSSKEAETVPDKMVTFDGIDDYVSVPNNNSFEFGSDIDFTVAFWTKSESSVIWATMASNTDWDSGSNDSWNIGLGSDGKSIDVNVGDGSNRADLQAGDVSDGEWHHIAATFDRDGDISLYIDGILMQNTSMAHVGNINSGRPLTFGRDAENEYFFKGSIDEVKIWNAALTTEQIREAMHITANLATPNLIAYYQFNDAIHSTVQNIKGSAHGSLTAGQKVTSTIPIGGGFANTQTENTGAVSFSNTDVDINFTAQNNAAVVVSKINLAPNISPTGLTRVFNSQYWAIHRYGTGAFAGNITFKVAEDLTTGDEQAPDEILLYGRNFNSDATWTLVTAATAVDATNDKAMFDAITNFDQFIIVSSSDGSVTAPADCLADMVYENRNDLPNLNSSTSYIKAGNINGSGEVVIESGQSILFRAKDYIQLMPGFTVKAGAEFTAKIEDCSTGIVADAPAQARIAPMVTQPEVKTALDMNVYPNPFETRFFIDYRINKAAQVTIQLFDLSGKKVRDILLNKRRKAGTYQAKFTNQNLSAGTYILRIQVGNEVSQRKVMMSSRE